MRSRDVSYPGCYQHNFFVEVLVPEQSSQRYFFELYAFIILTATLVRIYVFFFNCILIC